MADTISSTLDGIAEYKIMSDGEPVNCKFGLLSFNISREINKIGKALLVFEAGDMTQGLVSESDDEAFDIDKTIMIEAGYGNKLKSVFEGIVVDHSVNVGAENNTVLQVECKELPFKSTLMEKYKVFGEDAKVKDDAIINEVLNNYGLSLETEGAEIEHLQYTQDHKSDWEIALSRATANGLVTIVKDKAVSIKAPCTNKQDVDLEYGMNIIEFNAQLNVANLFEKVVVESIDSSKKTAIKAEAKVKFDSQPGTSDDKPLKDQCLFRLTDNTPQATLQTIANALALQISMAKITGSCKFCGKAEIEIGKPVGLKGFGKRFTGGAYVSSLEHDFKEDGWTTTIKFGFPFKSSATPHATVNGSLQSAIVTKIEKDPEKQFKIEVRILDTSGEEKKLWARLAHFWGNNAYGSFFIPEKGDEVVIGFFNNDTAHPVILGTMYSSALPAPYEMKDENPIQAITTKSKLKLEFDDKKKIITLETPAKNIIKINDEEKSITLTDQHQNRIAMNSGGIAIESSKAITMKAKTEIKMEAGTSFDAKAKTDMKFQGMNIEGKAKFAMKMAGTATSELSASGNTIVKGAMVMIN